MLAIRLFRTGKKHQPFYKIIVADKNNPPKGGRFAEELGFLNPITKENKINGERAKYWISKGAKPSDTVYNLLIKEKILEGKKIPVHKKSKKKQEEIKKEEVAAPAPAEENKPEEAKKEEPVNPPQEEKKEQS